MVAPWPDEDFECARCGISYRDLTVSGSVGRIRRVPADVAGILSGLTDREVRARQPDGAWSILEYTYHLRDVYATYSIRLHRARTEDEPILEPMLNDVRASLFRYNELGRAPVEAELGVNVSGFCVEVEQTSAEDWERLVRRGPGEVRSARWLVRQAAHEGAHHVEDIRRIAGAMSGGAERL
jgi:S-DNA-T family DNA segregation ATPase FtsK/SpoIIIE